MLCSCSRWTLTSLITPWSSTWTFTAFNPLQLHFTHRRKSFVIIIIIIIYIPVCRGCAGDTQMHARTCTNNFFPLQLLNECRLNPFLIVLPWTLAGPVSNIPANSHYCEHQPLIRVPMSQCDASKRNSCIFLFSFILKGFIRVLLRRTDLKWNHLCCDCKMG